MKKIILISLFTSQLFATETTTTSTFKVDKIVQEVSNEEAFGKSSKYALLFAKHELSSSDQQLHFYYGAKVGIISEEFTNDNGFGIPLNEMGAFYAATVGMEYDLDKQSILIAEALRSEDQVYQRTQSKLQLTYTYNY